MTPKQTTEFTIVFLGNQRRVIATLESEGAKGIRMGHPDTWVPPEAPEISFHVVDEKDQPILWLEEALNPGQVGAIIDEATRRFFPH